MSGRTTKWVILVLLPLVLALYASYPPAGVTLKKERVVTKKALTAEEAEAHGVEVGQEYVAETQTVSEKWLPLAYGERDVATRQVESPEEGARAVETTTSVKGRVQLGLDLAGGTELLYELKLPEGEGLADAVGNTIDILKERIDPAHVKEYRIQASEGGRILIQVPRATTAEVEQLKRRLEKMGKLEFKLAVPRDSGKERFEGYYAEADEGRVPEDYVKMYVDDDDSKNYYLVEKGEPQITGQYLASVEPSIDDLGRPAVGFHFDTMGARKFAQITERNVGRSLAIILDGVLRSAPQIQERISVSGIIRGDFTQEEVLDMVNILQAGSLPMDIELLQESTVGPELGRDSIRRGLRALAVAGLLVIAFIGVYYIGCGLVADGALIMNLVLLVGILCILGAALTLPGMAGILLTVGMAVDANVLIFERIREESAAGKGIRVALRNGYERAFTTIVDANVTTLLTAVILYLVGTGPVRGFAVTLSFGILLSMFTALVVTRLAFETFIDKGWMTEFRMLSVVGQPSIGFSRIRKPAYVMSLIVLVVGVTAFFVRGSSLYDIDFTGGSLVRISLAEPTPVGEIRSRLTMGGFPLAQVQAIRSAQTTQEGFTDFGIRFKGAGQERAEETILPAVAQKLEAAGVPVKEKGLDVTADGRAIELSLDQPVAEMDIRRALASEGDIYNLGDIADIVSAAKDGVTKHVAVHVHDVPFLMDRRQVLSRALVALGWAGLETRDYTVEECELADEGSEAGATLRLVLDQPLGRDLLAAEVIRLGFPEIAVLAGEESGVAFSLAGERDALTRFRRELPAGAELRGVPVAQVDGDTVTAGLTKEFTEADIRVLFDKQGLPDVYVVPLDLVSDTYRLQLSYAALMEKLAGMFGDLAPRAGGISFTAVSEQDADPRVVRMVLDEPMSLADVEHYVEAAGMAEYGESMIVGRENYSSETVVSGLELSLPGAQAEQIMQRLQETFGESRPVQQVVSIGATVAEELQGKALMAVVFASVIIVLYVAARFHAFRFGVAAVIALVHDVLITAGLIALADWTGVLGDVKINLAMLAAFLTILGYSLNDTIVVFDRIRENMGILGRKRVSADLIDLSINQTLSRTVLTSLTTLMVVVVLCVMGGTVLRGLALTLIFGVIVGTYSSMFIASPILLDWAGLQRGVGLFFRVVFFPVRLPFKLLALALGAGR